MTPYRLVNSYSGLRRTYYLHFQGLRKSKCWKRPIDRSQNPIIFILLTPPREPQNSHTAYITLVSDVWGNNLNDAVYVECSSSSRQKSRYHILRATSAKNSVTSMFILGIHYCYMFRINIHPP